MSHKFYIVYRYIIWALGMLCHTPFSYAQTSFEEKIFVDAELYTVRINTVINKPLINEEKSSSVGAGFIIDKEKGWILTNAHVAGRSPSTIEVRFKDGKKDAAKKIFIDPLLDVSIIKLQSMDIPEHAKSASLGCDQEIMPGHPVGAFGHPWNLYFTASRGIISGTSYVDGFNYLQTDASINSGNSGGPLISLKSGNVIGINTAKIDSEETEGLNFATPIDRVCKIISLIKENKNPLPPMMPISFFNSKESNIVKVANVFDETISGLMPGDIITGIDSKELNMTSPNQLLDILRGKEGQVSIQITRDNESKRVLFNARPMVDPLKSKAIYIDGAIITKASYIDQKLIGLDNHWLVNNVESGTLAESAEIQQWDFISHFNGRDYSDFDELIKYLEEANKKPLSLTIKRLTSIENSFFEYFEIELPNNILHIVNEVNSVN